MNGTKDSELDFFSNGKDSKPINSYWKKARRRFGEKTELVGFVMVLSISSMFVSFFLWRGLNQNSCFRVFFFTLSVILAGYQILFYICFFYFDEFSYNRTRCLMV